MLEKPWTTRKHFLLISLLDAARISSQAPSDVTQKAAFLGTADAQATSRKSPEARLFWKCFSYGFSFFNLVMIMQDDSPYIAGIFFFKG